MLEGKIVPSLNVTNERMESTYRRIVSDVMCAKRALSLEMVARVQAVLGKTEGSAKSVILCAVEQNNEYRKRVEKWIVDSTRIRLWPLKRFIGKLRNGPSKLFLMGFWIDHYYATRSHILTKYAYDDFENEDGAAPAYGVISIEPGFPDSNRYLNDGEVDYRKLGELVADWESEHRKIGIFIRNSTTYFIRGDDRQAISNALHDLQRQINNTDEVAVIHRDGKPIFIRFNVRYAVGGTIEEADDTCFNRSLHAPIPVTTTAQLDTDVQGSPTHHTKPSRERPEHSGRKLLRTTKAALVALLPDPLLSMVQKVFLPIKSTGLRRAWHRQRTKVGHLLAKANLLILMPHWFLIPEVLVPGNMVRLSNQDEPSNDRYKCMAEFHAISRKEQFAYRRVYRRKKEPEFAMATNLLNRARYEWESNERLFEHASKVRKAFFKNIDDVNKFNFMEAVDNITDVSSFKITAGQVADLTHLANFYRGLFKYMTAIEQAFGLAVNYHRNRFPAIWANPYAVQKWISENMDVLQFDGVESTGMQLQTRCFNFQLIVQLLDAGFTPYDFNPENFIRARWGYHNRLAWLAYALQRLEHYQLVKRGQTESTLRFEIKTKTFGTISGLFSRDMQRLIFNYYAKEDYLPGSSITLLVPEI